MPAQTKDELLAENEQLRKQLNEANAAAKAGKPFSGDYLRQYEEKVAAGLTEKQAQAVVADQIKVDELAKAEAAKAEATKGDEAK